jgi:Delta6-protoilludene synthase
MCSYRKELLANDVDYNAITVVMQNHRMTLESSIQWLSELHDVIVEHFLLLCDQVASKHGFPSFGQVLDRQIALYIDGLGE